MQKRIMSLYVSLNHWIPLSCMIVLHTASTLYLLMVYVCQHSHIVNSDVFCCCSESILGLLMLLTDAQTSLQPISQNQPDSSTEAFAVTSCILIKTCKAYAWLKMLIVASHEWFTLSPPPPINDCPQCGNFKSLSKPMNASIYSILLHFASLSAQCASLAMNHFLPSTIP